MSAGSFFNERNQECRWEIITAHDYNGESYSGGEAEDMLQRADTIFYSLEVGSETYYRYINGPFEDMGSLESAIENEEDFYVGG